MVVEMNAKFDGLIEVWFAATTIFGRIRVQTCLRRFEAVLHVRLFNRIADKPFFGDYTVEVLDSPVPLLDYSVNVGVVNSSKLRIVEEFFNYRVFAELRRIRWHFVLDPNQSDRDKQPRKMDTGDFGVLQLKVLEITSNTIDTSTNSRIQSLRRRPVQSSTLCHCDFTFGQQFISIETHRDLGLSITSHATVAFIVSKWRVDCNDVGKAAIRIRYRDVKSKAIAIMSLAEILRTSKSTWTQCIDLTIPFKPRSAGQIRVRLLWQPLVRQDRINSSVIMPAIQFWRISKSASMPYIGVLRISARQVRVLGECCNDSGINPMNRHVLRPRLAISFQKQRFQTRAIHHTVSPRWLEPLEFLVGDPFTLEQSRIVFTVFHSSEFGRDVFLGNATMCINDLLRNHGPTFQGKLQTSQTIICEIDMTIHFFPTTVLHSLGIQEYFASLHLNQPHPEQNIRSCTDVHDMMSESEERRRLSNSFSRKKGKNPCAIS